MSSAQPNRGRGRPSRNTHISQDGMGSDGPSLLYSLTHPPLYPDLLWHSTGRASFAEGELPPAIKPDPSISDQAAICSNGSSVPLQNLKRSSIITYTLHKQDEIQRSLHQEQVLLYSSHKNKRQRILSDILGDTRHFPAELFEGSQRSSNEKKQRRANGSVPIHHTVAPLEHLERQEEEEPVTADVISSASAPFNVTTEDEQVDAEEDEYADDLEAEEVEEELDYTQDYYASDPDSEDDVGDAEAIF